MTRDELRAYLDQLILSLKGSDRDILNARLSSLVSCFPFNEYEFILMFLRDKELITFADYDKLRANYVSANKYLNLFEVAPRIFGQVWGEQHIKDLDRRLFLSEYICDNLILFFLSNSHPKIIRPK